MENIIENYSLELLKSVYDQSCLSSSLSARVCQLCDVGCFKPFKSLLCLDMLEFSSVARRVPVNSVLSIEILNVNRQNFCFLYGE